jgi:hypothetical protein
MRARHRSHWTLTFFPSDPTDNIRLPNSTPSVGSVVENRSSVRRTSNEDLPTAESPTITYFRILRRQPDQSQGQS